MPFARRDLERLRLLLLAQRRLRETDVPQPSRQSIASKSYFEDAVRWLEIHGGPDGRELGERWRALAAAPAAAGPQAAVEPGAVEPGAAEPAGSGRNGQRRRRRRRRRRRPRSEPAAPA